MCCAVVEKFRLPKGSPLPARDLANPPSDVKQHKAPAPRPVSRPSSINLNLSRSWTTLAQIAYFLPSPPEVPCDASTNDVFVFSQPVLYFGVIWHGYGMAAILVPG